MSNSHPQKKKSEVFVFTGESKWHIDDGVFDFKNIYKTIVAANMSLVF